MGRGATVEPRQEGDGRATRKSARVPQSLPSTAFCLSSGCPQYSHLALCGTSVSMSPVWPSSLEDSREAMSLPVHTRTHTPEVDLRAPPKICKSRDHAPRAVEFRPRPLWLLPRWPRPLVGGPLRDAARKWHKTPACALSCYHR